MKQLNKTQSGFLLPAAIFILVTLAGLGAYALNISAIQQNASIQDIQSTRAYHAARVGVEWAAHEIMQNSPANCPATTTLSQDGFSITVNCSPSIDYQEQGGDNTITIYTVESTASFGTINTSAYIERRIDMTLSKCLHNLTTLCS